MALPYTTSDAFGSPTLSIGSVSYRSNGLTLPKPTREIRRDDTNGDRAEFQVRAEPISGSVTLQLATSATTLPVGGATFTAPFGSTTVTLVVTDVSPARPQGDFWTVDISYTAASGTGH